MGYWRIGLAVGSICLFASSSLHLFLDDRGIPGPRWLEVLLSIFAILGYAVFLMGLADVWRRRRQ